MPELVEVEAYRRLAERALGRRVAEVVAPDGWYLKRGLTAPAAALALVGRRLVAARRRGKLLMLDTSGAGGAGGPRPDPVPGPVLGLRFGMSGRLVVDGAAGVDRLLYSAAGAGARFERFALRFDDGGSLLVSDPRRLGGVELDPDEHRLGPDALGITRPQLAAALAGSAAPLKARLLDQARIAGIGNLIADEILWRAGLSPLRPAGALTGRGIGRLHAGLSSALAILIERGGSHTGDLMPERRQGGRCPRDRSVLARAAVGGRTTYWCPRHQR